MSQVRTHTRTVNGRKVTVRRHSREDDGHAAAELKARADENSITEQQQARRDRFQARVQRERKPAGRRKTTRRTPGERTGKKRGPKTVRAKRHAKKAMRLWRRHKVKALFYGALAVGEGGAWAACRGYAHARAVVRHLRKRRRLCSRWRFYSLR